MHDTAFCVALLRMIYRLTMTAFRNDSNRTKNVRELVIQLL